MKHIILILLFLPVIVFAQTKVDRSALNSSGGEYKGNNISVSYSIGETVLETGATSTIILTQGFQQPDKAGPISVEFETSKVSVRVFPNPTTYKLTIEFPFEVLKEYNYKLTDLKGETVLEGKLTGQQTQELDLSDFPNGTYFINIRTEQETQTVKIVKME